MDVLLETRGLSKSFGPTRALQGVDFSLKTGEGHALIGENGAGKSTLMKILSGALRPDNGEIRWAGEVWNAHHPAEAQRKGLVMIYQELTIAPDLSVEDNLLLGQFPHRGGWINRRRARERAREALTRVGHSELLNESRAGNLSNARQQIVEIARALLREAKVLILDEPTSSLGRDDAEHLFRLLEKLRQEEGVAVVYISHYLEECRRVASRYTVLRDGQTVQTGSLMETSDEAIVRAMVGREVDALYPERPPPPREKVLVQTRQLTGQPFPQGVDLTVRAGEIFGLVGLMGAGRTEILRTLFGLDRSVAGEIFLRGQLLEKPTPRRALARGVGFLSENRKSEGLLLNRPIADNLTLTRPGPFVTKGWIAPRRQTQCADHLIERLGIKVRDSEQEPMQLSGGNQQKVALGRLLHHEAEILLLDEPTRGIDVVSKSQIYRLLGDLAREGRGIILVSSYLPEVLALCHTIGVVNRGQLLEVRSVEEWTGEQIMAVATKVVARKNPTDQTV